MNKIKVLYLITGLNVGGAEIEVENLLKQLDKEKFEPIIASITPIGKIGKKIREDGFRVLSLEMKNKWNFFSILKLRLTAKDASPE